MKLNLSELTRKASPIYWTWWSKPFRTGIWLSKGPCALDVTEEPVRLTYLITCVAQKGEGFLMLHENTSANWWPNFKRKVITSATDELSEIR